MEKHITAIKCYIQIEGLSITVETNLIEADFLDVTFN